MRECHASQLRMRMRCRMARVSTQSTQTKAFVQHSYSVGCTLVVHCAAAAKRLALLFSRGKLTVSALVAALYPMRAIHSPLQLTAVAALQLPFGWATVPASAAGGRSRHKARTSTAPKAHAIQCSIGRGTAHVCRPCAIECQSWNATVDPNAAQRGQSRRRCGSPGADDACMSGCVPRPF